MLASMLSVGISGINAARMGLEVTQNNITNANTDGYSRQSILQSAAVARLTGSGFLGSGTNVDSVHRAYDRYLTQQTNSAQASSSEYSSLSTQLDQLDNMFADANAGLAPAIQDFFKGVQTVAANPSLVAARQSMLASSEILVERFNSLASRMSEMYDNINDQLGGEMKQVNTYADQIASLNGRIMAAEVPLQPPNDLLDMRDQLVAELSKHIRVLAAYDSQGNYNVFFGNGQQLVVGAVANSLQPINSSFDYQRTVVGLQRQSGSIQELSEELIDGGTLGGLMKFRENSLDQAANRLGMIAASMAMTFNAQHAVGQDLNGLNATMTGFQKDYFKISTTVNAQANSNSASLVTVNLLPPAIGSDGNFQSNLTGSDYMLRNDGSTFTLTRLSDGTIFSGNDLTSLNLDIQTKGPEGLSLSWSVPPTTDVNYLIKPTRDFAANLKLNSAISADTSRIAAAGPVSISVSEKNVGSLQVSLGQLADGYRTSNLAAAKFTYDAVAESFTFSSGMSPVVKALYANTPDPVDITGVSIPFLSNGKNLIGISFDGITINLDGTPGNGDSFSISANTNNVADSRNVLRLGALQTQKTTEGGTATYQGSFASLVSNVASQTRMAQINGAAQQSLYEQNDAARSAVSGVNLDEEAANLIRYQQAYQASAKALDIASKLFDTLLGIAG